MEQVDAANFIFYIMLPGSKKDAKFVERENKMEIKKELCK
jgi:hypothetical protein